MTELSGDDVRDIHERVTRSVRALTVADGHENLRSFPPDAEHLMCCAWSAVEEFDGDLTCVAEVWPKSLIEEIEAGADLTAAEFAEWKKKQCYSLACGTDWTDEAIVLPATASSGTKAVALLFMIHISPHHKLGMRPPAPETILEKLKITDPE